jgi:hypothetical protein
MVSLSQCNFEVHQIEHMEIRVASSLGWYLNPPTPFQFLDIISSSIDDSFGEYTVDHTWLSYPFATASSAAKNRLPLHTMH